MVDLAVRARQLEEQPVAPPGDGERFAGYGVMGLPLSSGHVLAMRRFPASSIGPAYTSVWHRDPAGSWTFWQDQPGEQGCARYFSSALAAHHHVPVVLEWKHESTLRVVVPSVGLVWTCAMAATPVTRTLDRVSALLPARAWRSGAALGVLGRVAGVALRAGSVSLAGVVPSGQHFAVQRLKVWRVAWSTARLRGLDLGRPAPLARQDRLGDFWIPQRGLFAFGEVRFTAT